MIRRLTKEGAALPQIPWARYPRPQLQRRDWLCLNGRWELECGGKTQRILVPFCPESLLSGVEEPPDPGEEMTYRRHFTLPEGWEGRHILLHFGAVSRSAAVFVNGRECLRHENGYLPFSCDISEALKPGENELRLRVSNDLDPRFALGKQSKKRGGMWYTPCSGIWQSVWLEPVPQSYVKSLAIRCGRDWAEITAEGVQDGLILLDGREIPLRGGMAHITIPEPELWSPEHPKLYRFLLRSGEDSVESYFALRSLTIETVDGLPRLCLNGKPYFFNCLLDQGYWSDGLYTPADPDAFARDILAAKALGFNTLRKHLKLEPEQFYYDCDRLGMIVFQDMVNAGVYRFVRDNALPTIGFQRRRDSRLNPDPAMQKNFLAAMDETVRLLRNHPSICLWTIFNEGWGQFRADEAYARLKALDPERFIDSTSGWFRQTKSDVESLHIYFRPLRIPKSDRPVLISEFGGYVWKLPEHSLNLDKTYGYRILKDRESFVRALRELYEQQVLPLIPQGLCGAIYTQLTDVEDETNGLLTFDRAVQKLRPEELADLSERMQKAIRRGKH